jgi:hypothetical protein
MDLSEERIAEIRAFCDRVGEPYPVTDSDYEQIIARMSACGF